MGQTTTQSTTKTKTKYLEPQDYKVVMHNDDYTPIEFVIAVLMDVFEHNIDEATRITQEIHERGKEIVGIYPYEIAEHKAYEAVLSARKAKHPLNVEVVE